MSRILYLDCFSGISGDMLLGALLDAGLPLDDLKQALGSLAVSGYEIGATRVLRAGLSAVKFDVHEASSSLQTEAGSPQLATARLGTMHLTSNSPHDAPGTLHQAPGTLHQAPGTQHQAPGT